MKVVSISKDKHLFQKKFSKKDTPIASECAFGLVAAGYVIMLVPSSVSLKTEKRMAEAAAEIYGEEK